VHDGRDGRQQDLISTVEIYDVDIVGAGLEDLAYAADGLPLLRHDSQSEDLPVIVAALRKRRGIVQANLELFPSISLGAGPVIATIEVNPEVVSVALDRT